MDYSASHSMSLGSSALRQLPDYNGSQPLGLRISMSQCSSDYKQVSVCFSGNWSGGAQPKTTIYSTIEVERQVDEPKAEHPRPSRISGPVKTSSDSDTSSLKSSAWRYKEEDFKLRLQLLQDCLEWMQTCAVCVVQFRVQRPLTGLWPVPLASDPVPPPAAESLSACRRHLGLCLYCGESGHLAVVCLAKFCLYDSQLWLMGRAVFELYWI
uniref:Uncharacterized protein n=1 Tax=Sphaerodactylus townsendi TaxID=933632 RepID=A0ACB8GCI4_9SAUR